MPSFIPAKDSVLVPWLVNFITLLVGAPGTYGVTAAQATNVQTYGVAYGAAYTAATDPSTRTPVTVAAKNSARAQVIGIVRILGRQIISNLGVSDANKLALGLNLPANGRTPVPQPNTPPTIALMVAMPGQHTLQFRDSANPLLKRKPYGVTSVQIVRSIGTVAATDPAQCAYLANVTKTPFNAPTGSEDIGKHCTYFARFGTRSGPGGQAQFGPWSLPLDVIAI